MPIPKLSLRRSRLKKGRGGFSHADFSENVVKLRNLDNLSLGELAAQLFNEQRQREDCDSASKVAAGDGSLFEKEQHVVGVQIRRGKMHEPPTVGQIDHHRPKVHQPLVNSLLGTRSRFDPVEFDSRPPGRFAYDFHGETGKPARRANLDRRIVLKTDAQRTGWNSRSASVEVPKREDSRYGYHSAGRDASYPSA